MSKPIRFVLLVGVLLVLFYFLKESVFSDTSYVATIKKERIDKNLSFRSATSSPLEDRDRNTFDSLTYYTPDIRYRVEADFEKFSNPDTVQMPMTTGETEVYLRFGKATFNLEGRSNTLILYLQASTADSSLFVPFTDKTNGTETYAGGRFLDVPKPEPDANTITLDFNKAYNPFCVYNYSYSCPIPPRVNRLDVPLRAGEKAYTKK
ncbi:DUF1684 domain-containing protein [Adhaeribacter aquaticus]|uniref:DUF1684 domain-containing protein n=1 Tax=Adhaeribacter aquaticus TaxID=299567 RepID=UPI0004078FDA|nr:DUF1684 domain-containing protein [Adhaeribacter aquaticus]